MSIYSVNYIVGILRNRWLSHGSWFSAKEVTSLVINLIHDDEIRTDDIIQAAKSSINWSTFKELICIAMDSDLIEEYD